MHVLTVVRSYLGVSQVALAKAAGITQADLSEMETREPYGKIKKYQRISEYLELPLDLIVKNDFYHFPVSFFDTHPEPAFTAAFTAWDGSTEGDVDTLILSAADRESLGEKIVAAANALAAKRGLPGELKLSDKTRDMAGGVVLRQGDIEVNCTLDSLLELSRGSLDAEVARILFQ